MAILVSPLTVAVKTVGSVAAAAMVKPVAVDANAVDAAFAGPVTVLAVYAMVGLVVADAAPVDV